MTTQHLQTLSHSFLTSSNPLTFLSNHRDQHTACTLTPPKRLTCFAYIFQNLTRTLNERLLYNPRQIKHNRKREGTIKMNRCSWLSRPLFYFIKELLVPLNYEDKINQSYIWEFLWKKVNDYLPEHENEPKHRCVPQLKAIEVHYIEGLFQSSGQSLDHFPFP